MSPQAEKPGRPPSEQWIYDRNARPGERLAPWVSITCAVALSVTSWVAAIWAWVWILS